MATMLQRLARGGGALVGEVMPVGRPQGTLLQRLAGTAGMDADGGNSGETTRRLFPSYMTEELERKVAAGRGSPEMEEEIARRKSGESKPRITPQLPGLGRKAKDAGIILRKVEPNKDAGGSRREGNLTISEAPRAYSETFPKKKAQDAETGYTQQDVEGYLRRYKAAREQGDATAMAKWWTLYGMAKGEAGQKAQDAGPGQELRSYLENYGAREVMALGSTTGHKTQGGGMVTVSDDGSWSRSGPGGRHLDKGNGLQDYRRKAMGA